jgi:ceramide glucosyltransferase
MVSLLALAAAVPAVAGITQAIVGAWLTRRFAAGAVRVRDAAVGVSPTGHSPLAVVPAGKPPWISVLKPLHGAEPLLEAALASTCAQDFPAFQVVFGASRPDDPALAVVERLRQRFPQVDIALVVDPRRRGKNPKIGNLINMLPAAKHEVLVIADSDLHVPPDWLTHVVAALEVPGVGLVCTLYAGLPATGALVERLAAMQITHTFLPGAVLSRALGRQDCLGATMALRRETLARIGGLEALVDHLADDNVLGRRVRALGLGVALADTVPATTVPEARLAALWRHELRWARTIRALVPGQFAASVLQYPIVWAMLALALSGGALWTWSLFETAWVTRVLAARVIDRALRPLVGRIPAAFPAAFPAVFSGGLAFRAPLWLLPVREVLSVGVMLASYAGRAVDWRGDTLDADRGEINGLSPPAAGRGEAEGGCGTGGAGVPPPPDSVPRGERQGRIGCRVG